MDIQVLAHWGIILSVMNLVVIFTLLFAIKNVDFKKVTNGNTIAPVIIKNDFEEGTGHHSVIKYKGTYYAIYHGRDYLENEGEYSERRTARVSKLEVKDGVISAIRFADKV